jgi:serine/threonine-protein kinase
MSNSCPRCGAANATGARFCNQCSTPLASVQTCPHCGQRQAVTAKFCNGCGQSLTGNQAAPIIPMAPLLTGRLQNNTVVAGRYAILRKLGQGGMGAVYLVADTRLAGKQYALKEMSDQANADPAERQAALLAFQQEAQLLANLDHPNLPKVTDSFPEGSNYYLVMEYVQGETLDNKLAQMKGPLPEPTVRRYAEQLCDVLDYLHHRQPAVIFRDLKPTNIMIQPGDRLKLIDFGIARHFKPGKSKDTQAMGTPGYAAPEQYGKGQSDARTDIYALGATLHHMLTGRDPGSDPFRFPSARLLNPVLSGSIDQIVMRAVELDPNQRWQTIRELRNALFGQTANTLQPTFVSTLPTPLPAAARMATQASLAPVQPVLPPLQSGAQLPVPYANQPGLPPLQQLGAPGAGIPGYSMSMPPGLLGTTFAGYSQRVVAYLIDVTLAVLLMGFLLTVGVMFASSGSGTGAGLGSIIGLLALASSSLYFMWGTANSGQTPGKKMLGIKVVDGNGAAPGWGKAFLRYVIGFGIEAFLMYFLIGLLGWLWPLWDKDKQAWHDKIASTYVIDN